MVHEGRKARVERWERQFALLATARELDRSGRLGEAIAIYEQLVTEGLEHAHIYLQLGVIYRKAKQYDDEIRVMEKGLQVWRDFDYGELANKGEPIMDQYAARLAKAKELCAKAMKGKPE